MRYVARQPILDARGNVHGYEMLFREGPTVAFSGDGDAATRDVLDNLVAGGIERLAGESLVFVNCTREALLGRLVMVLPPGQTVLELLETLEPTAELLRVCVELKAAGYRLALDDFEWKPEWEPFLRIADYVKVDMSVTSAEARMALIQSLHGCTAHLVAERVETREDLEIVQKEGFTLFQGYYFCKPVLMKSRRIPPNLLVQMEMLQALQEEPLDVARVSGLVKRDAALTYRLLRIVNSAMYAASRTVTSIDGALIIIGDEMFRRIATVAIAGQWKGNQSSELLQAAFVRGRFCESIARFTGRAPKEQYLMGVLSLLPVLISVPMTTIVEAMPLRPDLRDALLGESNAERTALDLLLCYEAAHWESCDRMAAEAGIPMEEVPRLYEAANQWARENVRLVG